MARDCEFITPRTKKKLRTNNNFNFSKSEQRAAEREWRRLHDDAIGLCWNWKEM